MSTDPFFSLDTPRRDPASGLTQLLFAVCVLVTYANPAAVLTTVLAGPDRDWVGLIRCSWWLTYMAGALLAVAVLCVGVFFYLRNDRTRLWALLGYLVVVPTATSLYFVYVIVPQTNYFWL